MKPCRTCERTDVVFSNMPGSNANRFYTECDTCRELKMTTKKTCTICAESLPVRDFYVKGGSSGSVLQACCKVCYNARKREHAAIKNGIVTHAPGVVTDNPFLFRTFVQPVRRELYEPLKESNRYREARA